MDSANSATVMRRTGICGCALPHAIRSGTYPSCSRFWDTSRRASTRAHTPPCSASSTEAMSSVLMLATCIGHHPRVASRSVVTRCTTSGRASGCKRETAGARANSSHTLSAPRRGTHRRQPSMSRRSSATHRLPRPAAGRPTSQTARVSVNDAPHAARTSESAQSLIHDTVYRRFRRRLISRLHDLDDGLSKSAKTAKANSVRCRVAHEFCRVPARVRALAPRQSSRILVHRSRCGLAAAGDLWHARHRRAHRFGVDGRAHESRRLRQHRLLGHDVAAPAHAPRPPVSRRRGQVRARCADRPGPDDQRIRLPDVRQC